MLVRGFRTSDYGTDVDDTEDKAVLGAHRQIASLSVTRNWGFQGRFRQQLVHLFDTANLVGGRIDREHEHKDDGKENRSMRAASIGEQRG